MFPSWRVARPFGINLFIHWSFWLLPLWVFLTYDPETSLLPLGAQLGLLFAMFACVVLHELGHALTARAFGIPTGRIVLTPIGGVAQFEQPLRSPGSEYCVALAGPVVNLAIAAGLAALHFGAAALDAGWVGSLGGAFVYVLLLSNLVMAVFNLIPAFPMDGGRVLRALLAGPLGILRATRVAVLLGSAIAVAGGVLGVLLLHTPWPLAIALFVLWSAHAELAVLEAEGRVRAAGRAAAFPVVVPVRSTAGWPPAAGRGSVYVWDAGRGLWVRAADPGPVPPG